MKKGIMFLLLLSFIGLRFHIASGAPKDTVVIAQGVDPTTMDPHYRYDSPAFNITMNIFENLLIRPADLKIEPLLATSYQLINDTTWEFALRKGVKFHN
jgi:peptide/nickel transport system substrate-binding protein